MGKKILFLLPELPFPLIMGGHVRVYNLIKGLSRKNDIYLLCFTKSQKHSKVLPDLKKICKEIFLVPRYSEDVIENNNYPRSVRTFYTYEMINKIEVVKKIKFDLIQIDFLIMSAYINHLKEVPVVYTEHDMSNISFSCSIHDRDLPEKERFFEWQKIVCYEKEVCRKFAGVIVLTERDQEILKKFLPEVKSEMIPTGTDTEYYRFEYSHQSRNLVYTGHYAHYPNTDAMVYFCKEIFPKILRERPETKIYIVGSAPTPPVLALRSKNVIISGEVKDIRPYLRDASVFIAPIRLGGGIKGKILEAMATGLPVITTSNGNAGIRGTPDEEILIADNPDDFAQKTIELLNNKNLWGKLSNNARKFVEEKYNWEKIVPQLDSFYDKVIRRFKNGNQPV